MGIEEIDTLHSKASCGVVYLSELDKAITPRKRTLFILMNGKSQQVSDERVIVASVANGSYSECKTGLNKLIDMVKH